jgi:hypothetical protein
VLGLLGNSALAASERQGIFRDLESFLVRRLVCGRPNKNYNRLFLQVLRDFEQHEPVRASFRALLAAGTGEAVDWPDDKSFERAWNKIDAYSELKPAKVEMIMRALNEALVTGTTEPIVITSRLTVEHILPQEWKKHWPLPADVNVETATEAREDLLHAFGNLTLLTQPLNSSVSNGPASEKLPKIALDSALRINTRFQSRSTWGEKDIRERGADLFVVAKKVWPAP